MRGSAGRCSLPPFHIPALKADGARRAAVPALGLCVVTSCPLVCSTRKGHGQPGLGGRLPPCEGGDPPRDDPSRQRTTDSGWKAGFLQVAQWHPRPLSSHGTWQKPPVQKASKQAEAAARWHLKPDFAKVFRNCPKDIGGNSACIYKSVPKCLFK